MVLGIIMGIMGIIYGIMMGIFAIIMAMFALMLVPVVLLVVGIAILDAPVAVAISVPASLVLPNSYLPQVEYYINQEEEYSNYAIEGNWKWMGCSIQSSSRGTFEEVRKMEDRVVMISKLCNWNVKKKTRRENEKADGTEDGDKFHYNAEFSF